MRSVASILTILLASTIWCPAQRGTMAFVSAAPLPTNAFKQTILTWDYVAGASNRVSWGAMRNAWTNGSRIVFTNLFPVTNGTAYRVTTILNGMESDAALWPSNRLGEIWLTGYGTNRSSTNIVKLISFTNNPPGLMSFWGIENRTIGWQ